MHTVFWQTACMLASLGIKVFPVGWASKAPYHSTDWRTLATNDVNKLSQILPQASYGLAAVLGPGSGIMDVEYDSEFGANTWRELHREVPEVRTVAYQSHRGIHRWFRWSPELATLGKTIPKVRGIEVRLGSDTKGIYSVVPPSAHPSGGWYQWLPGCAPWEVAIAPLPHHLLEAFTAVVQTHSKSSCEVTQEGDDWVPEPGQRHQYMLRLTHLLAGTLRLPRELVYEMMVPFSQHVGKFDDLGDDKAERELKDMIGTVQRPQVPEAILRDVDFGAIYETANTILQQQKVEQMQLREQTYLPTNVFPSWLEQLSQVARQCQMPRHFILMTALTVASAAIGCGARVRMSIDQMPTGLQLYTLGVGESGSGKSRALNRMTDIFRTNPNFATDATTEALRSALNVNPRGVLLKVVEGKQFTRMLGRYSGSAGQAPDNSLLLEAWSGDPIVVMRQDAKKNLRIDNPFLSVAAAIQPHNLGSFSADDILEGLMQRMCVYAGDEVPSTLDPKAGTQFCNGMKTFTDTIMRLQTLRPFVYKSAMDAVVAYTDSRQSLQPVELVLTDDARGLWVQYSQWKRSDALQSMWVEGHPFRNDLVRHAEIALRIAAILMLWEMAEHPQFENCYLHHHPSAWVDRKYLERAIVLVEWLWSEKQRIMLDLADDRFARAMQRGGMIKVDTSLKDMLKRLAERRCNLLTNRLKGKKEWSLRDYYRHLRMNVDEANQEVALFLQHGLVKQSNSRSHAVNSLITTQYEFAMEMIRPANHESR